MLSIEDVYDHAELNSDDDDSQEDVDLNFEQFVVFDSATDDSDAPKIKEVLSHKESILRQVLNDSYLYLEMKVVLKVMDVGDDEGSQSAVKSEAKPLVN